MTKLHKQLWEECEVKLKVSQFMVQKAVTDRNENIEFLGGQMFALSESNKELELEVKRLNAIINGELH